MFRLWTPYKSYIQRSKCCGCLEANWCDDIYCRDAHQNYGAVDTEIQNSRYMVLVNYGRKKHCLLNMTPPWCAHEEEKNELFFGVSEVKWLNGVRKEDFLHKVFPISHFQIFTIQWEKFKHKLVTGEEKRGKDGSEEDQQGAEGHYERSTSSMQVNRTTIKMQKYSKTTNNEVASEECQSHFKLQSDTCVAHYPSLQCGPGWGRSFSLAGHHSWTPWLCIWRWF